MGAPVDQRIDLGVAGQMPLTVAAGVEARRRIAALTVALQQVMLERIDPGLRHVRVGVEVEGSVEFGDRADRLATAAGKEVGQRRGLRPEAMRLPIPDRVETGARRAALPLTVEKIVRERVVARSKHVVVAVQIPRRVEVEIRPPLLAPALLAEMQQRIGAFGDAAPIGETIPFGVEQTAAAQAGEPDRIERAGRRRRGHTRGPGCGGLAATAIGQPDSPRPVRNAHDDNHVTRE